MFDDIHIHLIVLFIRHTTGMTHLKFVNNNICLFYFKLRLTETRDYFVFFQSDDTKGCPLQKKIKWSYLVQDRDQSPALRKMMLKLRVPQQVEDFLIGSATISFYNLVTAQLIGRHEGPGLIPRWTKCHCQGHSTVATHSD